MCQWNNDEESVMIMANEADIDVSMLLIEAEISINQNTSNQCVMKKESEEMTKWKKVMKKKKAEKREKEKIVSQWK